MLKFHLAYIGFVLLGCFTVNAFGQPKTSRTYLLNAVADQQPNDTGSPKTTFTKINDAQFGTVFNVALADSIGQSKPIVKNWAGFSTLVLQLGKHDMGNLALKLNVKHAQTKNYATRIDIPVTVKPGRNEIRLTLADLENANGSAPDLSDIKHWYLATNQPVTLFLGDVWLEGAAGKPITVASDPARLNRIRAATMPKFDKPIMFNTPEADAICSALEVYPENNAWNLVIEDWPVHPNSKNIVNTIGGKKVLRYNPDMGFLIVPPDQKKVDVKIVGYPGESDPGPFPVPDNTPIEGWPIHYMRNPLLKKLSLDDVQRDNPKNGGDRHAIIVDPINRKLYEFFVMKKTDAGWTAAQSSIFDLASNKLRPDTWTSADAAGLPIFPSVVRYDELKRGIVEHALRVTFVKTRHAYVHPATHYASKWKDENLPRMGERFRLRKDFDTKGFSPEVQAILKGLQKYGMLCADNGIDWAISVAPDPRIPVLHEELRRVRGSDFEVVVSPPGYVPAK
ncbi:MAG: hypothetical protein EXS16_02625 [Gemmataceae bacterium]|nr:hypothetical protein [Gemmataceae bacterium]